MKLARIENNEVAEVTEIAKELNPKTLYHPDLNWVEVPDDQPVEPGWLYQDGQYSPPAQQPLSERKAEMVARIKAEAYQRIEDIMPIWTVIRSLTGGPALSDAVKTEAQRLRQVSNTLESQVNAMGAISSG